MTISFDASGDFKNTERFIGKVKKVNILPALRSLAMAGVRALASATPVDSGLAADSWGFEITRSRNSASITWTNSDVESGFPVAIMLQYGHGTRNGGYVKGRDYINPAMQPVFDKIAEEAWKVVTSA